VQALRTPSLTEASATSSSSSSSSSSSDSKSTPKVQFVLNADQEAHVLQMRDAALKLIEHKYEMQKMVDFFFGFSKHLCQSFLRVNSGICIDGM
jgi:hypothetical protein